MVKKYKNIDDLISATIEVPKELWFYEELMREKPNFNKSDGAKKIYQRKNFAIYRARNEFIVHNLHKSFKSGHTHIKNYHKAKSIIDLSVRKKLPLTLKKWELQSLLRIADDETFKLEIIKRLGGEKHDTKSE